MKIEPAPDASILDLSQHSSDAILAVDCSGNILRINPAAGLLLGVSEQEAAGKRCSEVLNSALCHDGCPRRQVAASGEGEARFNVAVTTSDGGTLPVCIGFSALRDAEGNVVGTVESIRDIRHVLRIIDEGEAAARRAEQSNEWLRSIIDTIGEAVIATNREVRITSFNRAAEVLTGYSRDEVLGRSCKDVFSNGFCPLEETIRKEREYPGIELAMRGKGGRPIPVWLSTQLLRDGSNAVMGALQVVRERQGPALVEPATRSGRYAPLIGDGPAMAAVYDWIDRLAPTDTTVLLTGESGTGKELVTEQLHYHSPRRAKPLIKVNCAALPEHLLESELFGHVRGAFTGAIADRPGRFELAHQGTLFLDEIGDLPLPLQSKLLRVLQDRCVERLGSGRPIPVDLRIIAATNRDLEQMVANGSFRQDLYYRLAVVPLRLPPLREHCEDIPALAASVLRRLAARLHQSEPRWLSKAALAALESYHWPGNVRELENALEFAAIRAGSVSIGLESLPPTVLSGRGCNGDNGGSLGAEAAERDRLLQALRSAANAAGAAQSLGISRATLFRRLRQLGLKVDQVKSHA
jgi:PAS domain S-box-containing protein